MEDKMQYNNYRENRRHGTADFPLAFYHVTSSYPQYVMPLHWHVEFELIHIVKGSIRLTIDDREFDAAEGSCVFVPAGSIHSGIPDDCIYDCIVFDMNMLMNKNDSCCRMIRRIVDRETELFNLYTRSYNDIHQIVLSLFDAAASRKLGYQPVILGALYQFFGTIFSNGYYHSMPPRESRSHKRIVQLKTALEFMESSYNTPVTLEEISRSVDMSPKYFCRFFHEMTHRTPIDYLNYYRIERACYQLMTTDLSITEIAYASGFNDLSYFIKTFKKYKGTTPKKYMKT